MKRAAILLCCALSAVAFGQRKERKAIQFEVRPDAVSSAGDYRPVPRSARVSRGKVKSIDATVPQAPGVLQINTSDRDRTAWFVITDVIPKGSQIIAYVAPDGDNFLKLGPVTADEDLRPGRSFALPKLPDFGVFWPNGITTYDVVVRINGQNTHSAADFAVGGARNYDDLGVVLPLIYQWREDIVDRQLILTIEAELTADPVQIVLEDLVVPQSAITRNGGTLKVNLSKVPGSRLDLYQDFLMTIGQGGYSDTRVFTHVPFNPKNYDPAPAVGEEIVSQQ